MLSFTTKAWFDDIWGQRTLSCSTFLNHSFGSFGRFVNLRALALKTEMPQRYHSSTTVLPVLFTRLGKRVPQVFGDFEIPSWAFSRLFTWSSVVSFLKLPRPSKTFRLNKVVAKPHFVWSLTEHDATVRKNKRIQWISIESIDASQFRFYISYHNTLQ